MYRVKFDVVMLSDVLKFS